MKYITTDGNVSIEGGILIRKKITKEGKYQWLLFPFLGIYFADRLVEAIDSLQKTEKVVHWIGIILFSLALLFFAIILFEKLFRQYLKKSLPVSRIVKIKTQEDENGLDIHVILTLQNNRYILIRFRKLENQVAPFIQLLSELNPGIEIVNGHAIPITLE